MRKNKSTESFGLIDPFTKWAHKTGRIFMLLFLSYTFLIPIIMCIVYGCWPSFSMLLPGMISITAIMLPTSIAEVASYVPVLGSSTYLTWATGNLMNLKVPCAIEAQKMACVEPNSTEGDCISLISTCVSSITTIVILALGLLLIVPLQGVMQNEFFSTASNYVLPALFGCMSLGILGRGSAPTYVKNKLWVGAIPALLVSVLTIMGWVTSGMAGYLLIVMIPISILAARILWKKGIVDVAPNPSYKNTAAKQEEN